MSPELYEFNPVSSITIGSIGRPGHRTFFLQVSGEGRTISLKMEKEQVAALAHGIDRILEELEQQEVRPTSAAEEPELPELDEQEAEFPTFVVGQIGLGFDQTSRMMVLVVQGFPLSEEEEPGMARLWVSPGQMRALSRRAKDVVAQGRPICPLCHQPIDPEGHFCPRSNGHNKGQPM
ncbi:MAG: DUF3090 family protein [Chloroflexi bacterium]|nr:DUF3090 family protein [Chloroflexota bacterium]